MAKKACAWHRTDENGICNRGVFTDPDGDLKVTVSYIGAQITIDLTQEGKKTARMSSPIYFCPICGERVRLEEKKR